MSAFPQPIRAENRRNGPPERTATARRHAVPPNAAAATWTVAVPAGMVLTVLAVLVAGKAAALTSLFLFAGTITLLALNGRGVAALSVYFGYAALEGLYKYTTEFSEAVYVVKPLLVGLLILGWALHRFASSRTEERLPLAALVAFFAGWALLLIAHPLGSGVIGGLGAALLWYVAPLALYVLGYRMAAVRLPIEQICILFVAICTVVSAVAVFQFVMGQNWTTAHFPGYASIDVTSAGWVMEGAHGERASGWRPAATAPNAGGGAFYSHLGALLAMGLLLSPSVRPRTKTYLVAALMANVLGLLISGVRLFVLLGAMEALVIFVASARSPQAAARNVGFSLLMALIGLGGFVVAQALSGGALATRYAATFANPLGRYQSERSQNLASLPAFIFEYPLGIGYQRGAKGFDQAEQLRAGSTGAAVSAAVANRETQWNSIAADLGLPGLLLLLLLLAGVLWRGGRVVRYVREPHLRVLAATFFALLLGYALAGFGGPILQGADHFWLLAGALFALPAIERRERFAAAAVAP